jgi:hypothetical protein
MAVEPGSTDPSIVLHTVVKGQYSLQVNELADRFQLGPSSCSLHMDRRGAPVRTEQQWQKTVIHSTMERAP